MQSSMVVLRRSALPSLSRFSKAAAVAAKVMASMSEENGPLEIPQLIEKTDLLEARGAELSEDVAIDFR
eukprot:662793-Alexandrium_andersonii.AAC.1